MEPSLRLCTILPLVVGEGAKRAGAKAAPVAGDGEAHRLQGRDNLAVRGMGLAGERKLIDCIQLCGCQGQGRPVLDDDRLGMGLDDRSTVKRVLLFVVPGEGLGVFSFIRRDLGKAGYDQAVITLFSRFSPAGDLFLYRSSGHIPDLLSPLAVLQPQGYLPERALAHSINEQIGRRICQNGAAHCIRPIIVVGEPPQTGLDPAQDDGHAGKEAVDPVGVNDGCPVRPAQSAAWRIDIRASPLQIGRQIVDHGVHVSRGYAEE